MKSKWTLLLQIGGIVLGLQMQARSQDTCGTYISPNLPSEIFAPYGDPANLVQYRRTEMTDPPLRLAIHIVTDSEGNGGLSQSALDSAIDKLNEEFAEAYMSFSIYRQDVISDDAFVSVTGGELDALRSTHTVPGAINVYFVPQLVGHSGISTPSWAESQGIVIANAEAATSTTPHEMGHYFDLFHTHHDNGIRENIPRYPDACSNSNVAADGLDDTPADRGLLDQGAYHVNPQTCTFAAWKPWGTDGCGRSDWGPLVSNLMSWAPDHCRNDFSQMQIDKMNRTLEVERAELLEMPVALTNQVGSTNAGGTLYIGNEIVVSGEDGFAPKGSIQAIGTDNERFENFQGSGLTYKHNNWNDAQEDWLLERNLEITQSTRIQNAKFVEHQPATISTSLIGGGTAGPIQFKDPWYVADASGNQPNTFISFSSPHSPTGAYDESSGGVFLNQGDTLNLQPPYYSVKVPLDTIINGSVAFFAGWSYDPAYISLAQPEPSPSGYDQKAVVFKQAGATLTAQYSHSTISLNTTLPAGTYPIAGSLTVSSGVTLTLGPGTTLEFPTGATLTGSGKITADGTSGQKIIFTRRSGSNDWQGISLSGSGANGSLLRHCTISYAKQPVVVNWVSSLTINLSTINNSSFYDENFDDAAALRFYHSSPTISFVTIKGQSNSWNGVRFAEGSTGSIESSTIDSCGAGNGIVVQGGSSPVIQLNTIRGNCYHGIIVVNNGSGSPVIVGNTLLNNGIVGGVKTYVGIDFYNSTGKIGTNTAQGSNYGVYFDYYSSPTTWWTGSWSGYTGNNTLSGNLHGLVAYWYSNPIFGQVTEFHGELLYQGNCNNILNNTTSNAYVDQHCSVKAEGNWWGQAPPTLIFAYNSSSIAKNYWGTASEPCPSGGGWVARNPIGDSPEPVASGSGTVNTNDPVLSRLQGDYTASREAYESILSDETATRSEKTRALVGLYEVLRDSRDVLNLRSIEIYKNHAEFGSLAEELVMNSQVIIGDYDKAKEIAKSVAESSENEQRNHALLLLASLESYSDEYRAVSKEAKEQLQTSGIDEGILVALGTGSVHQAIEPDASAQPEGELTVSNYPNPFNPTTTISFTLPSEGHVRLRIYDVVGRLIHELVDETRTAGSHQASFDGSRLPSGVYIYRLEFMGSTLSRKFILAK